MRRHPDSANQRLTDYHLRSVELTEIYIATTASQRQRLASVIVTSAAAARSNAKYAHIGLLAPTLETDCYNPRGGPLVWRQKPGGLNLTIRK